MRRRWKEAAVLGLLVRAVYGVLLGVYLPQKEREQEAWRLAQEDARTHDVTTIYPHESPYMGDAVNLAALLGVLPLPNLSGTMELESDQFLLRLVLDGTYAQAGEEETVKRNLLYESVALCAAVENLQQVSFVFDDREISHDRATLEEWFGADLRALLEKEETWKTQVQDRLDDVIRNQEKEGEKQGQSEEICFWAEKNHRSKPVVLCVSNQS